MPTFHEIKNSQSTKEPLISMQSVLCTKFQCIKSYRHLRMIHNKVLRRIFRPKATEYY